MKKSIIVIIALLYSFISVNNGLAANAWTQKADFGGGARAGVVGFSIGSKGYIGTGSFSSLDSIEGIPPLPPTLFKDFWEYNPAADTWTQKADFGGEARGSAVGFSIGNKGYIGTGVVGYDWLHHGPPTYNNDFWEYDPAANTWTQKADFGGDARYRAIGFSIGNKGYIGTGIIGAGSPSLKDFWEYDPALNTWTQRTDFEGTARGYAVGFSIGSKGYIGMGDNDLSATKDFWEYDPALNTWTQKADFGGTVRDLAVGFSIESKGYIGTGVDIPPN
jgi:N-acetylneuraminic acid mutarotase